MKTFYDLRQGARFRPHDCCYKCLLPQRVCQPNSQGRECFARELIGVFLASILPNVHTFETFLPEVTWYKYATDRKELVEVAKGALEADSEVLRTQTPRIVLVFIRFCTLFKDKSEAIE